MKLNKNVIVLIAMAAIAGTVTVTRAGEEKEETLSLDKVPDVVHKALAAYAQDTEVKKAEVGDEDGKKVYEFDIEQGGKSFELSFSKKGKFMGREEDIQLSDMPAAAQTALQGQAGDGKLSGFEKAEDKDHKITYEADIEKGGKKTEVAVDENGKVISTEDASADKD
jgi:uncharacterized membrane protein YkoI